MSCKPIITTGGQPFPKSNHNAIIVDKALPPSLKGEDGQVFSYKLTTLKTSGRALVQYGNAPNYQGGKITLCTCMHYHRTWPRIAKGIWIAGFSDNASGNKLFYLMKVDEVVKNFALLWNSRLVPSVREKSASRAIYGDVYEPDPNRTTTNPHSPTFYCDPIADHKHLKHNEWHKDVRYWHPPDNPKRLQTMRPRLHKLLIGEDGKSFVWEHPMYRYKNRPHPRNRFHDSLADFFDALKRL